MTSSENRDQQRKRANRSCHLFLSSSGLISLLSRTLLTLSEISGLASCVTQLSVCTSLDSLWHITLADLLDGCVGVNDWDPGTDRCDGLGVLNLLLGSVTLLVLTQLAGEENEAGLVGL